MNEGGGLLLYVSEYILCRKMNAAFCPEIEAFVIEINLNKKRCLLISSYIHDGRSFKEHKYAI